MFVVYVHVTVVYIWWHRLFFALTPVCQGPYASLLPSMEDGKLQRKLSAVPSVGFLGLAGGEGGEAVLSLMWVSHAMYPVVGTRCSQSSTQLFFIVF